MFSRDAQRSARSGDLGHFETYRITQPQQLQWAITSSHRYIFAYYYGCLLVEYCMPNFHSMLEWHRVYRGHAVLSTIMLGLRSCDVNSDCIL